MNQPLQTVLEQAERQRDAARAALAQAEQALQRLRLQAQQLHAYRDDYHRRGPTQVGRSAAIEVLHCHHAFMARLDQALQQQQAQLQAAQAQAARLRALLLERETRLAAVRKLLERRALDARAHATRQEQRRGDESALRSLWAAIADPLPVGH